VSETWLRRLALLAALVVTLAFHFRSFTSSLPNPNAADGASYLAPALNLAGGRGFVAPDPISYCVHGLPNRPDAPDTLRTPGYPLFLAAVLALGLPPAAAIVLQHLLVALLTVALFLVTERLTGRWQAALPAALLLGTFPPLTTSAQQYMTEVLTTVAVLATLVATWRAARGSIGWAAAAGLLSGCATLIRPIALFWFLPLALVLAWRARRTLPLFLLAALVLPGAWVVRNYRATGVATISSIGGDNLLFFRAAGALVVHDQTPGFGFFALQRQFGFYRNSDRARARLAQEVFAELRSEGIEPRTASHAVLARHYGRFAVPILLHHLPETLELSFSAMVELFVGPYLYIGGTEGALFALFVLAAAVYGLTKLDKTFAAVAALTIAYFAVMAAGPESGPRFAVPFEPPYAIAFGAGVDALLRRARVRAWTAAAALRR